VRQRRNDPNRRNSRRTAAQRIAFHRIEFCARGKVSREFFMSEGGH
jgi:hypothetical protein